MWKPKLRRSGNFLRPFTSTYREYKWHRCYQLQYEMEWKNLLPNVSLWRTMGWVCRMDECVRYDVPCNQEMWVAMLRPMTPTPESVEFPIILSVDSPIEWHPNWWLVVLEMPLPSTLPTREIPFYCQLCIHNYSHGRHSQVNWFIVRCAIWVKRIELKLKSRRDSPMCIGWLWIGNHSYYVQCTR